MPRFPSTPATRLLKASNVEFSEHSYRYEDRGGTSVSARELGVDEHSVVKTLIMEDENGRPLIVLMHGDLEVSTKELARQTGCKAISPCKPDTADKHSGYQVGGTSPFGVRKAMPVYMEQTIPDLPKIYINGGSKGFLIGMNPKDAQRVLSAVLVQVGCSRHK
ncbi:MAG: Cys-tRNA(Pro) deacylase [Holophagales bacterium]|nr:Cys-tRNA(Pro) deacylase [Holophagales bacterium]